MARKFVACSWYKVLLKQDILSLSVRLRSDFSFTTLPKSPHEIAGCKSSFCLFSHLVSITVCVEIPALFSGNESKDVCSAAASHSLQQRLIRLPAYDRPQLQAVLRLL